MDARTKGGSGVPFKYDKLLAMLKEKGINTTRIRRENIISQSAWQKIRTGSGDIDTRTLGRLCALLECQPGDIMEYTKEETPNEEA